MTFTQFLCETTENNKLLTRGNIKFTIWKEPNRKVTWLKDNEDYLKIEYKYLNSVKGIKIEFLLGRQGGSWKLWIGKPGIVAYDDDPWCSFDTNKFSDAILACLDKVESFIHDVNDNKENWVQFYTEI